MSVYDYSGQWLATSDNGFPFIIIDLDSSKSGSVGSGYAFSQDHNIPSASFKLALNTNKKKFSKEVMLRPFDARAGVKLTPQNMKEHFPNSKLPEQVKLEFERQNSDELLVSWKTETSATTSIRLERSRLPSVSHLDPDTAVHSWPSFRDQMTTLEFRKFIFRGQSKPYPLQTTFHRTKRKDLEKYLSEDIRDLHHSLAGHMKYVFNLDIPQDLGALLNLAQHHGFPTPLLDWTYSPFVAAWFAFEKVVTSRNLRSKKDELVRIYSLNRDELTKFEQFLRLTHVIPHTSLLDALPIENKRAVPQQGLLMSTNVQDIEAHLFSLSQHCGKELLVAFDIPVSDAEQALNDLAMMGITRSTMMPGIESACLELKQRLFS